MIDLSELKPVDTFTFNLKHPATGENLDTTLTVFGKDSKKYKSSLHRLRNDKLRNPNKKTTSEQIDSNGIELLANVIESWEKMGWEGEELECNLENKRKILAVDWIFEQVDTEVDNRANFLQPAEVS